MWNPEPLESFPKPVLYERLAGALEELLRGERDFLANAANTAALLYHSLPDVNWVGLYRWLDNELVLGPFQGKPACVRIPIGRGVCGTAAAQRKTLVVPDVHAFPGHIACDPASRSEIVIPLLLGPDLVGVWDMDSPQPARFDQTDRAGLERLMQILLRASFSPKSPPAHEGPTENPPHTRPSINRP
ncbi:GAF domain-containing protein [Limisphaera sp. 4302-co]|uniref:GAF domain-containing protein n=1 Tax=Limisphaera sp. 4302-co TaxID=3400417 RepID=UPI003C2A4A3C